MGIFGGVNLDTISEFCELVFAFVRENKLNVFDSQNSKIKCNVFMEQIFFAVISKINKVPVATVLNVIYNDNGYSEENFCNFVCFDEKPLLHVLGGHKRKRRVCRQLQMKLACVFPLVYSDIKKLFISQKAEWRVQPCELMSVERSVAIYEDFVSQSSRKTADIPFDSILLLSDKSFFCQIKLGLTPIAGVSPFRLL